MRWSAAQSCDLKGGQVDQSFMLNFVVSVWGETWAKNVAVPVCGTLVTLPQLSAIRETMWYGIYVGCIRVEHECDNGTMYEAKSTVSHLCWGGCKMPVFSYKWLVMTMQRWEASVVVQWRTANCWNGVYGGVHAQRTCVDLWSTTADWVGAEISHGRLRRELEEFVVNWNREQRDIVVQRMNVCREVQVWWVSIDTTMPWRAGYGSQVCGRW